MVDLPPFSSGASMTRIGSWIVETNPATAATYRPTTRTTTAATIHNGRVTTTT